MSASSEREDTARPEAPARRTGPGRSEHPAEEPGVRHDQTIRVDLDLPSEVRVHGFVAVAPARLEARVALAIERDLEAGKPDVDNADGLGLPAPEAEAADGQRVREGGGREVDVDRRRRGRGGPLRRDRSTARRRCSRARAGGSPQPGSPRDGGLATRCHRRCCTGPRWCRPPEGPSTRDSAAMPSTPSRRIRCSRPSPDQSFQRATTIRLTARVLRMAPRAAGSGEPAAAALFQARAVRRRTSSALGGAPTMVSAIWPSLKKRSVGMACTP